MRVLCLNVIPMVIDKEAYAIRYKKDDRGIWQGSANGCIKKFLLGLILNFSP